MNRSLSLSLALGLCILFGVGGPASAADVCPNLSGQYFIQGEDGQVRITITQTGCAQIRIDRTNTYLGKTTREQHTLRIDGQFHPVLNARPPVRVLGFATNLNK